MSNWTIFSFTCCPCSLSSSRMVLPCSFIRIATIQIFWSQVALPCSTHLLLHPIVQHNVRKKASERNWEVRISQLQTDWTEMPYSARSHYHLEEEPWEKHELLIINWEKKEIERNLPSYWLGCEYNIILGMYVIYHHISQRSSEEEQILPFKSMAELASELQSDKPINCLNLIIYHTSDK